MDRSRTESLQRLIANRFPGFGINKRREIERLVYEIARRDSIPYQYIINGLPEGRVPSYLAVKNELLKQRFPVSTSQGHVVAPYLPKLDIDPKNALNITNKRLYPEMIYIEEAACGSALEKRLTGRFPLASLKRIKSLKGFMADCPPFTIADYNKRRARLFVINERYDFFKKCPCTSGAVSCGYHIFNLGFGCIYECTYCYLQEYTNCPGIILPANIEAFFSGFNRYKRPNMRIGTGEFTDSLALDDITQYSLPLIEFFAGYRDVTFEFKTKSANISNLLGASHAGNIVVSWSLNPRSIIKDNEFYTASLEKRLKSALECVRAGYRVGFHFDPIFYYKKWAGEYEGLVNRLFDTIPGSKIAWISLGTLRFNPRLKKVIENRFPDNKILNEELQPGFDNKLRYAPEIRSLIYENMIAWIRKRDKKVPIYLCMEKALI